MGDLPNEAAPFQVSLHAIAAPLSVCENRMPQWPSDDAIPAATHATPVPGFASWGPQVRGANAWSYHPRIEPSAPVAAAADPCERLIATPRGAVLVMLPEVATAEDLLAALQAAHTQVQREMLARRTQRAA
jgi:hypothetical protein